MNILDTIGNTPLMNIENIYFKMEMMNPSGSIKDRVAKAMMLEIYNNLKYKAIKPHIVEASSGNTGVSVAMVCASLGLQGLIYVPKNTSIVKIKLMKSYGAKVYNKCKDIADCISRAEETGRLQNFEYLEQFHNQKNIDAQRNMAIEAFWQLKTKNMPDAIVAGVGTGGTIMGLHDIFPHAEIVIVQPLGSDKIEGICDGVKLSLIPRELQINVINVPKTSAIATAKWLAEKHGIHCGISSGANYYAATLIKNGYKTILTVLPDSGNRYL